MGATWPTESGAAEEELTTYDEEVLADNPAFYFTLGSTSGNVDKSLGNCSMSSAGTPTFGGVTGPVVGDADNTGTALNGSGQRLTVSGFDPFVANAPRTIGGWAYRTSADAYGVLFRGDDSGPPPQMYLGANGTASNKDLRFTIGTTTVTWPECIPREDTWFYWVLTRDETRPTSNTELFINGQSRGKRHNASSWASHASATFGHSAYSNYLNGGLARVFGCAAILSPERIAAHYLTAVGARPR